MYSKYVTWTWFGRLLRNLATVPDDILFYLDCQQSSLHLKYYQAASILTFICDLILASWISCETTKALNYKYSTKTIRGKAFNGFLLVLGSILVASGFLTGNVFIELVVLMDSTRSKNVKNATAANEGKYVTSGHRLISEISLQIAIVVYLFSSIQIVLSRNFVGSWKVLG